MNKRLYLILFIIASSVLCIGTEKEPILEENQTIEAIGEVEEYHPIQIEAINEVPINGVFAAQIHYKNINNASSIIIQDHPGNMTWIVNLQKEEGRIGLVYPVGGPGYITAEYRDGSDKTKREYEIVSGEQELTSFIIESWALMHMEITSSLSPGDRTAFMVGDTNKSFTIIVTEDDIEVREGADKPDLVFNIYKNEDLLDFVGTEDLGMTIKEMIAGGKMSVQLKTGNLAKLSRFIKMAKKLGVI